MWFNHESVVTRRVAIGCYSPNGTVGKIQCAQQAQENLAWRPFRKQTRKQTAGSGCARARPAAGPLYKEFGNCYTCRARVCLRAYRSSCGRGRAA